MKDIHKYYTDKEYRDWYDSPEQVEKRKHRRNIGFIVIGSFVGACGVAIGVLFLFIWLSQNSEGTGGGSKEIEMTEYNREGSSPDLSPPPIEEYE